jgi:putative addiction module killer protein
LEIRRYVTLEGRDAVQDWLAALRDVKAKAAILRRVNRLELGNFGDHKPCRDGVWELRVDTGPGYRVYYARSGESVVLLLCAGDKRRQAADIDQACGYWRDWQTRDAEA